MAAGQVHGGPAVAGLGHHVDPRVGVEQRPEAGPDELLVVDDDHPDHASARVGSGSLTGNLALTRKPSLTQPASNRPS